MAISNGKEVRKLTFCFLVSIINAARIKGVGKTVSKTRRVGCIWLLLMYCF